MCQEGKADYTTLNEAGIPITDQVEANEQTHIAADYEYLYRASEENVGLKK